MSDSDDLVLQSSISQSEWIDFIFTPAQKMVKCITSRYTMDRRKVYIWMYCLSDDQRRQYAYTLRWIQRVQRLQSFVRIIKMRKTLRSVSQSYINNTDLLGDSLVDNSYIYVCLNSQKIRYTLHDVISLIQMHLEQRDQFSSKPRLPIDPYTNKQWTTAIMYKILGWIRNQNVKYKSIPYSLSAWLHSGYIQFFRKENTMPYHLSYYLEGNARYNYCKESNCVSNIVNSIQHICQQYETTEYHSQIDWDKMAYLPQDYVLKHVKPILLFWIHPNNEWITTNIHKPDYMLQRFKHDILMMAETAKCIIKNEYLDGSPRRTYRRRIQNYILV